MRTVALRTLPALATLVILTGCAAPPREGSGVVGAAPLVGRERRIASASDSPAEPLRVPVPPGATRAIVRVAAIERSRWQARRRTRALVARSDGSTVERPLIISDGRWTGIAVDLERGVASLTLRLEDGAADDVSRAWWSVRFDGVAPAGARNVLLVSLDTVRRDAVSALGQPLPTTPRLDELAARGTLFTQAIAPAPWTLPSHVSVMTGVLPSFHQRLDPLRMDHELPQIPTLAALLAERGYDTAAVTGSGVISWALGTTRGFASVIEHDPTLDPRWWRPFEAECDTGARDVVAFLEGRAARDAPFFLFWHTYEPHSPYHDERFLGTRVPLPAGIAEDAREDWQRYLGDLARADAAFGAILDTLEREHLAESTDIVVMSDHGEDFGEHSSGVREDATRHGNGLFETQLRVPLVIVSPSVPPGVRDEQVSLLDLFPTILAMTGTDAPPGTIGHALQVPGGSRTTISEALYPKYAPTQMKCVREEHVKYVARLTTPPTESLTDPSTDPLDTTDIAPSHADDVTRLRADLLAALAGAPSTVTAQPGPLPPSVLESLKSLGYVE